MPLSTHQATKFTLACIGLFMAAFTSEWVGYRRRLVFRADNSGQQNRRFWMVLLYAVQVTSGYFLMLAAMTYQVGRQGGCCVCEDSCGDIRASVIFTLFDESYACAFVFVF